MLVLLGKFNALKNTRKSTGDPSCPTDVAPAKRVYRLIEAIFGLESTAVSAAGNSRTGKTHNELEQLCKKIQADSTEVLSESARKRRNIDRLIDKLESDDNDDWCITIVAMEEHNAARQLEYRRERDTQRRQDELRRQAQDERREE
ncbi:hypothetical protein GN958_ATG15643 [Phytophthora infestans]|uniref:Uncharacterized protein n=1 Tax=Phytophthora infestans TaxID=4787 RepID=A0A8S9U796_PHYIN|nr:hypothetical protein GN958_ATG15643 [Phytophthora infestans]